MRLVLLAAIAAVFTLVLAGCSANEVRGLGNKPWPKIRDIRMNRTASTITLVTNRLSFDTDTLDVWRVVSGEKRYLNFQFERAWAEGDSGKAIFVFTGWNGEALSFTETYYVLVKIRAEVYDYDHSYDNYTPTKWVSAIGLYQLNPDGSIVKLE